VHRKKRGVFEKRKRIKALKKTEKKKREKRGPRGWGKEKWFPSRVFSEKGKKNSLPRGEEEEIRERETTRRKS